MNNLLKNGFIKLKNILNDNDYLLIENNMLNDNKIKYFYLKKFIDEIFLQKINNKLNWNCLYTKFIFNNNINNVSIMNRDIQSFSNKLYPIFTCITCLDDVTLKIIPGSHFNTHYSIIESLLIYYKSKTINLKRGDILIYYSTLLYYEIINNDKRRLLKVLNVYKNDYDYNKYSPKILHILENNINNQSLLQHGHINHNLFIKYKILNIFVSLNSATGYGYDNNIINLLKLSNITYISQEKSKRLKYDKNKYQQLNLYFINDNNKTLSENKYNTYFFYCYTKQFIIYSIIFIIIIIIIYKLFSHYFKK
jgi:hypothetical protein